MNKSLDGWIIINKNIGVTSRHIVNIIKKTLNVKKRKHLDTVRGSGKAGSSKRVIIPQQIFQELDWKKGDSIVIRRSGKNKIIIEKSASK